MIFVSYSHKDEKWRDLFKSVSTPLSRTEHIQFWSDQDIKHGKWEKQLEQAMKSAAGFLLLVSDNFLASEYIMSKEWPYFLDAHRKSGRMIFWIYVEPGDLSCYPEIREFQAITLGTLDPLCMLSPGKPKKTMVLGCQIIKAYMKDIERPVINPAMSRQWFPKIADSVPLLAKPTRHDVEVLVYAGNKWWRQWRMKAGTTKTKIQLGNDQTKKGTEFTVIALTTKKPLTQPTYTSLPEHRTKSDKIILIRK